MSFSLTHARRAGGGSGVRAAVASLAVVLALVLAAPLARAQEEPLTEDQKKEKAASYYGDAQKAFDEEKYEDALTLFRMADKLLPAPVVDYNIAKCYERLSRYEEALKYYQSYLKRYKEVNYQDPPDVKDVSKTIEFLNKMIHKESPEITITSDPAGAEVYFTEGQEHKLKGSTPFVSRLDKGEYPIKLVFKGFHDLTTTLSVSGEEKREFTFRLDKVLNIGALEVKPNVKNARIYLDGKVVGLSPLPAIKNLESGEHQVFVEKERYTDFRAMVKVETNQSAKVDISLKLVNPPSTWRSYLGWSSIVLGVLSAGAGIAFWQLGEREYNFNRYKNETYSTFKQYKFYQNLGYGLGGGLAGVGLSLLIWEWVRPVVDENDLIRPTETSSNSAAPLVGGFSF
jgi:tetratricopeptide (TPR) repeat protein